MTSEEIKYWIMNQNPNGYTLDVIQHLNSMCLLIYDKMMNPKIKECSFIEHIYEGDWNRARIVGDIRNKEAIDHNLYQNFVEFVKKSPEYVVKIREEKLKILDI